MERVGNPHWGTKVGITSLRKKDDSEWGMDVESQRRERGVEHK